MYKSMYLSLLFLLFLLVSEIKPQTTAPPCLDKMVICPTIVNPAFCASTDKDMCCKSCQKEWKKTTKAPTTTTTTTTTAASKPHSSCQDELDACQLLTANPDFCINPDNRRTCCQSCPNEAGYSNMGLFSES